MRSIRWKLIIMTVALLAIVMVTAGSFIIVSLRGTENDSAQSTLRSAANVVADIVMRDGDARVFRARFENNLLPEGIEGSILESDGRTIATTAANDENIGSYPVYGTPPVIAALGGEAAFAASGRKYPDADGRERRWFEYAMPVTGDDGETRYVVYVRMAADNIYAYIDSMTRTIALAIALAMLGTVVLGFFFATAITVPITTLTRHAKEFAAGKLDGDIDVKSNDEIGQMTETFNEMAHELAEKMNETNREKSKLEIVVYNMTDGVLAYDEHGQVIHYNGVCQELLGIDDIASVPLAEMLSLLGAERAEGGSWRDTALSIGERYVSAAFNPYKTQGGDAGGMIIVLQDVTRHMKLDNLRKDFVANVSHEIRTPITTIKSYTETLLDGAIDDRDTAVDFLSTINAESDRMMRIVTDLLDLSRLDSGKIDLQLHELDLVALLRENVRNHAMNAARVNKTVTLTENAHEAVVAADAARVNQVLNNIISNSLKYSGENAKVSVSVESSPDYYRIYVQDNGIGIPKEDLRHIFDRFYRVDKARSRDMGGTGLGLSIAREIMEAHGGKITAYSEVDKGTTMILRFPKAGGGVS